MQELLQLPPLYVLRRRMPAAVSHILCHFWHITSRPILLLWAAAKTKLDINGMRRSGRSHVMGYLCMFVGALWFLAPYACSFAIWTCVMSLSGGNASCHSYPFWGLLKLHFCCPSMLHPLTSRRVAGDRHARGQT